MPLTDTAVRRAAAKKKPYKLFDSGGLFLLVNPNGGKWWRFKYRFNNKEKLLSLGTYPDISLKVARDRRDQERKKLADKIDPAVNRKAVKAAWADSQSNSFEIIALEWIDKQSTIWAASNTKKITGQLKLNIFPWLGSRPIAEITAPELLVVLRRTEARGAIHTAHKILQTCGQIFRYAIATGRAMRDPAADLRGALQPARGGHHAAITEPKAIGPLLRAMLDYQGSHQFFLVLLRAMRSTATKPRGWTSVSRSFENGKAASPPLTSTLVAYRAMFWSVALNHCLRLAGHNP